MNFLCFFVLAATVVNADDTKKKNFDHLVKTYFDLTFANTDVPFRWLSATLTATLEDPSSADGFISPSLETYASRILELTASPQLKHAMDGLRKSFTDGRILLIQPKLHLYLGILDLIQHTSPLTAEIEDTITENIIMPSYEESDAAVTRFVGLIKNHKYTISKRQKIIEYWAAGLISRILWFRNNQEFVKTVLDAFSQLLAPCVERRAESLTPPCDDDSNSFEQIAKQFVPFIGTLAQFRKALIGAATLNMEQLRSSESRSNPRQTIVHATAVLIQGVFPEISWVDAVEEATKVFN